MSASAKLQMDLKSLQESSIKTAQERKEVDAQLTECLMARDSLNKTVQELHQQMSQLKSAHHVELNRSNEQLLELRNNLTGKEQSLKQLNERVAELEPLIEAIEHEKMRRIKVY